MSSIDIAIKHFGTTNNIAESGYILTNGKFLDLSEKNNGGQAGYRTADHRDVNICYDDKDGTAALIAFMNEGNIRLLPENGGIDLSVKPNDKQKLALRYYINYFKGECILDISTLSGNNAFNHEYSIKTASTRILNDIENYFNNL